MADGEIRVSLDNEAMAQLVATARAAGLSAEAYAARLVGEALRADRWAVSGARLEAFARDGRSVTIDEAMSAFDEAVAQRRARSR
jgi:hypothetical protein